MKMKSKIKYILLLAVLCFGLTACGEEPDHLDVQGTEMMIMMHNSTLQKSFANPYQVYNTMVMFSLALEGEQVSLDYLDGIEHGAKQQGDSAAEDIVMVKGIRAYLDNQEDIGNPRLHDEENPYYYVANNLDGVTAVMDIDGDIHNATIEYIYNNYYELTNINISVQLSLEESMKKAGINTLIGMGTVFAMLIMIMIIISAMKIIPTLQNAFAKKKEEPKGSEASINNTIAGIIERETAEADSDELIAVIAAAIAAASAESGETGDFVVRSIRRVR